MIRKFPVLLTAHRTFSLLFAGSRTARVRVSTLGDYLTANRTSNIGGAVAVVCVGFVILRGFTCANLPSFKVGNRHLAICVFVILSAFATVVIIPTVNGTGCALAAFKQTDAFVGKCLPDGDDIRIVVDDDGITGLLLSDLRVHCRITGANAPVIEGKSFGRGKAHRFGGRQSDLGSVCHVIEIIRALTVSGAVHVDIFG